MSLITGCGANLKGLNMIKLANEKVRERAHAVIPGGAHTYSRGDDQYPENAPAALVSGKGCHVLGTDGREYLDFGMALRSVVLGYADERVNRAAIDQIAMGNNLTRASLTEIEAAEQFCATIPGCDMVKFAKNGSTVVSAAIKLARAYTGRKLVARCAQHPFFSFDDWFIGDTDMNRGVPDEISKLTLKFDFNDAKSLQNLFDQYPGQIACVILEPATSVEPTPGFLNDVIAIAKRNGAVSVLDEMITGFRWSLKGASDYYGVSPDLKTFGKGMANGFSVAALGGARDIMQLGGIKHSGERVFLISTTHGAEMCGLGAFLKVLEIYKTEKVTEHLWSVGAQLIDGMNKAAAAAGIADFFSIGGAACSPLYYFKNKDGNISQPLRTLFMQEMVEQGVLIPWVALSVAHTPNHIKQAVDASASAFRVVKQAIDGGVEGLLRGAPAKPVFRKFN